MEVRVTLQNNTSYLVTLGAGESLDTLLEEMNTQSKEFIKIGSLILRRYNILEVVDNSVQPLA